MDAEEAEWRLNSARSCANVVSVYHTEYLLHLQCCEGFSAGSGISFTTGLEPCQHFDQML